MKHVQHSASRSYSSVRLSPSLRSIPVAAAATVERMERRMLLSATGSISGTMFNDVNGDHAHQSFEPVLAGWGVYLDKNNNGKYDGSDVRVFSDTKGNYSFPNLAAGTYHIRQNTPAGWLNTNVSPPFPFVVNLAAGQKVTGENILNEQLGVATLLSNGTLYVTGTNAADNLTVNFQLYQDVNGNHGPASVKINGTTQTFDGAGIDHIAMNALGGNDTIQVNGRDENDLNTPVPPTPVNVSISGGDGNDSIYTSIYSFGYETAEAVIGPSLFIDGGAGNDNIFANGGDGLATLNGGDGNDTIESAAGGEPFIVTMNGGDGNDALSTGSSGDANQSVQMYGDNGNDTFYNDDIDDSDSFFGGPGTDTILIAQGSGNYQGGVSLPPDIENATGTWDGDLTITGNNSNNYIHIADASGVMSLVGGGGDDSLNASGSGATVYFDGGAGNDLLTPGEGVNHFSGGAGIDAVDYSKRTTAQRIYLDGSKLSGDPSAASYFDYVNNVTVSGAQDTFDGTVERAYGGSGDDLIVGNNSDDALFGFSGNDTLVAGSGQNALWGGDGNDLILARNDNSDYINGGAGDDTAQVDAADTVTGVEHIQQTPATLLPDGTLYVVGTDSADTISVVMNLSAGPGTTSSTSATVNGNLQNFSTGVTHIFISALAGADTVQLIFNEPDLGTFSPSGTTATVLGGAGNDQLDANMGFEGDNFSIEPSVYMDGGDGNDTVNAIGDGSSTLHGGNGNDILYCDGNDIAQTVMYGDAGDDSLDADLDADTAVLNGGDGNDTFYAYSSFNQNVTVNGGAGSDTFVLTSYDYESGSGPLAIFAMDGQPHPGSSIILGADMENITGQWGSVDLKLIGNAAANTFDVQADSEHVTLNGGDGNDTLYATGAHSTIFGGNGNDLIQAANGRKDYINGDNGNDTAYVDTIDTVVNVETIHQS